MILATQSSDDFNESTLLQDITDKLSDEVLLSNPGMDVDRARTLFHLNHTEAR